MIGLCFILQCQMAWPDLLLSAMHGGSCPSTCALCFYFHRLHILHPSCASGCTCSASPDSSLHPSCASGCTCSAAPDSFLHPSCASGCTCSASPDSSLHLSCASGCTCSASPHSSLHPSFASGCTCSASPHSSLRMHAQAAAPAGAPVAAKTKEEAIAKSKNVSAQQQPAAPQADRMPAPPRKAPAPVDPKEVERKTRCR